MITGEIDDVLLEPLFQCPDLFDNETFAALSRKPVGPTELSPTKICVFLLVFVYYSVLPSRRILESSKFLNIIRDILFKGKGGHSFSELCSFLNASLSNENSAYLVTSLMKVMEPLTKDFSSFYVKLRSMCDRLIKYCQIPGDDPIAKDFANFFWHMADLHLLTVMYEYFKAYVLPRNVARLPEKVSDYTSDSESDGCRCTSGLDSSSSLSVEINRYHVREMAKQLYAESLRASSIRHNNRMAASCLFPLLLLEKGSKQVACFKSLLLTMRVIPNPGMPANLMDVFSSLSQLTELAEEAAKLMKTEDVFNDAPRLATVANAALSSYALLFGDYRKAKDLWTDLQRQRCISDELFEGESSCLLGSNYTLAMFLQGHIKAAKDSLQNLKLSFSEHEFSHHWRKCEASMDFTSSFFKQDNASCKDNLVKLATFSPLEAKLKYNLRLEG
ncbi:hypothetical protein TTRE_0000454101 [Trichuris trichiura]|uniref:Anaphase-promoting complex subunit 5 n=1 Tax=Trichuris trichiura TaxID=36087 RepID=A0A077Z7T2_TRITR|nr:hypothetical protein TTRE_0000454101 [Trichuris trichiura]